METLVPLTEKERKFLLSIIVKLPIQVTLETINDNKTIDDMLILAKKLQGEALNSEDADDTISTEEG